MARSRFTFFAKNLLSNRMISAKNLTLALAFFSQISFQTLINFLELKQEKAGTRELTHRPRH